MTWDPATRRAALAAALEVAGNGWRRYDQVAANAIGAAQPLVPSLPSGDWEVTTETPTRPPTAGADVGVPILQAMASGVFAAAGALVIRSAGADVELWAVAAAGVGVSGLAWAALLADHRRLLRETRTVAHYGEQDQVPGGQVETPARDVLRVEVMTERQGQGPAWCLADLPESRATLRTVAAMVDAGTRRMSRRDLTGIAGMGSERARVLLVALEAAGFIAYPNGRNDSRGGRWTSKGRALSRALLE